MNKNISDLLEKIQNCSSKYTKSQQIFLCQKKTGNFQKKQKINSKKMLNPFLKNCLCLK